MKSALAALAAAVVVCPNCRSSKEGQSERPSGSEFRARVAARASRARSPARAANCVRAAAGGLAGDGAARRSSRVSQDTIVDGLGFHQTEMQPVAGRGPGTKMMVGAFEVGRQFSGGSSAIGFANSSNGGGNWKNGLLPLTSRAARPTTALGPL